MICTRKSVILRVFFPLPIGGPTLLLHNFNVRKRLKKSTAGAPRRRRRTGGSHLICALPRVRALTLRLFSKAAQLAVVLRSTIKEATYFEIDVRKGERVTRQFSYLPKVKISRLHKNHTNRTKRKTKFWY